MKILVTGGLGYIGSHTAIELSKDYETVIVDNLINSNISTLKRINKIGFSKIKISILFGTARLLRFAGTLSPD